MVFILLAKQLVANIKDNFLLIIIHCFMTSLSCLNIYLYLARVNEL